jgi:hypothetical protein
MSNIVELSDRLRDGREIKTDADFRQWMYEYLDEFSKDIGQDRTPIDVFPVITRVMVEWCDGISGLGCDKENAQALAQAVGELTRALETCLANLRDSYMEANSSRDTSA